MLSLFWPILLSTFDLCCSELENYLPFVIISTLVIVDKSETVPGNILPCEVDEPRPREVYPRCDEAHGTLARLVQQTHRGRQCSAEFVNALQTTETAR